MTGCGQRSEKSGKMLSFQEGADKTGFVNITVQGKPVRYDGATDVRSLLESHGENSAYANVRINGSVLNRRDFENIQIYDGDKIDFLYFMGGGTCST